MSFPVDLHSACQPRRSETDPCPTAGLLQAGLGSGIRVCVVEDDADLRAELADSLQNLGFQVRVFPGSRELYAGLLQEETDLVLLDVMLPGENGFSVAARMRAHSGVGIVMLTGRNTVEDRVQGLLDGADAYLCKPVQLAELVATLISVHRRSAGTGSGVRQAENLPRPLSTELADAGAWTLSVDGWLLHTPAGQSVQLSRTERSLVRFLLSQPNSLITRQTLIAELSYPEEGYAEHRLDMLFSRLRNKIAKTSGERLPLSVVRGQGFIFRQGAGGDQSSDGS